MPEHKDPSRKRAIGSGVQRLSAGIVVIVGKKRQNCIVFADLVGRSKRNCIASECLGGNGCARSYQFGMGPFGSFPNPAEPEPNR